jgi:undecaprenyl-diphosphatase
MLPAPNAFDLRWLEVLRGVRPGGGLTWLMVAFTILGSGWTAFALLPLYRARRARPFVLGLSLVWVITAVAVYALKAIVRRPRPCATVPALWGTSPTDPSFPSGHAAGAFAFAAFVTVLCLADRARWGQGWRWLAAGASLAAAACVALSRVYLGVHFPTDVLAGGALGGLVGVAGAIATRRRIPERP